MPINIALVLGWKFNHEPGIETSDGELVAWPESLGKAPTKKQIADWTAEYQAWADKESHNKDIISQLDMLDIKAIRPLLDGDADRIAEIAAQKTALRSQLMP